MAGFNSFGFDDQGFNAVPSSGATAPPSLFLRSDFTNSINADVKITDSLQANAEFTDNMIFDVVFE